MSRHAIWTVLRRAAKDSLDDGVPMIAQALAYSLFLAIPAVMLVVLGLFSLAAEPATVESLIDRVSTVTPEEAATLLRDSLRRTAESDSSGIVMTVLGLALAAWTTTSAATTLMHGIAIAFDRDDRRRFVRERLVAFAIVSVLAGAAGLVLGLLVLGPHIEGWVGDATRAPTATAWLWWSAQWPLLVAGLLFAFGVVLYLAPDVEQRSWKLITPGAVTAVVLWLVGSGAFAIYAAHFGSYDKTWGTLSAVVVTLVWLWLTSAALLFGAEINAEAQKVTAVRGDPHASRAPSGRGAPADEAEERDRERGDQEQEQELRERHAAADGEHGEDDHE